MGPCIMIPHLAQPQVASGLSEPTYGGFRSPAASERYRSTRGELEGGKTDGKKMEYSLR